MAELPKMTILKLIQPSEILDMAKRHDQLPDAPGIKIEDSNILDFADELLALYAARALDIAMGRKTIEQIQESYKCRCGKCCECNWARSHE
jgi:hypothetical protein